VQNGGLVVTERTEVSACAGDHRTTVGRRSSGSIEVSERTATSRSAMTTRYQRHANREATDDSYPDVAVAPFGG